MRILVVDDELITVRSVELMLKRAHMTIHTTDSGVDAVALARSYDYDLIVLDLGLPDLSGHDVLRQLRHARVQTPVLVLSGDDALESKLTSFRLGADDYLTKPCHYGELLARIQTIVKRAKGHGQRTLQVGRLSINTEARMVAVEGKPVPLTNKEYKVLELLALRWGKMIPKEAFINHLYGGGLDEPESKILDTFICRLRRKLAAATGEGNPIATVWGRGYILHAPAPIRPLPQAPAAA